MHIIEEDWTTASGLRAVVLIICYGERKDHRCGYVGVPKGHPLHGLDYDQHIPDLERYAATARLGQKSPILALTAGVNAPAGQTIRASLDTIVDVHGGITYAGGGKGKYPVESDLWWFGYDCAHSGDGKIEPDECGFEFEGDIVRDLDYCIRQCESLAHQITELFPSANSST
jgi:hypothetical protein